MTEKQISLSTIDAVEVRLDLANVGSRAYAFFIDWHIRAVAALVVMVGLYFVDRGVSRFYQTSLAEWIIGMVPAAIYFLYHPILEVAQRGLTPGKRWARIRVVARDGGPPSTSSLLIRNLFRIVDSLPIFYALGFVVMLVAKRPGRIGDLAAGTLVVHDALEAGGIEKATRIGSLAIAPQTQILLEEWLERWKEIEARSRDAIAHKALAREPAPPPANLAGTALREHVRARLTAAPAL